MTNAKIKPPEIRNEPLLIALLLLSLPVVLQAQFTYTTNNGAIIISGCDPSVNNALIPATINGYPVTDIGNNAFNDRYNLTNVVIPDSVTNIGSGAFALCTSLKGVSMGAGVKGIGNMAFAQCASLLSINIPGSVRNIGAKAFMNCSLRSGVTIGNGVANIGSEAFENSGLASVIIPDSVVSIGDIAFNYSLLLTSATIGSGVTNIGSRIFNQCPGLTNITVDTANPAYSSLNGVLFDKAQATLIMCPEGFSGSYIVPNGVTNVGAFAFAYCGKLSGVVIADSVTVIEPYAFEFCSSLGSLAIGNGVSQIGDVAFYYCSSLTNLIIGKNTAQIGYQAFAYCSALASVTLGGSITNLGHQAFAFCFGLKAAYFQGNPPPDEGTAFSADNAVVYYLPATTGWDSIFGGVPAMLWNPWAKNAGLTAGQFGFDISGPPYGILVVEACTNLSQPIWIAVSTNNLSDTGNSSFSDSHSSSYPRRFYRFRSP